MEPQAKIGARLRGFFRDVARSCYDMEFYRGVRRRPWTAAFRYSAAMQACLVLVATLFFAPFAVAARSRLAAFLDGRLPASAAVRIEKGRLATSLPDKFDMGTQDFPVIVDTSVEGVKMPDSVPADGIVVGKDAIFMANGTDRRAYPLADFPDVSVTKSQVLDWLGRWSGWFLALGIVFFAVFWYLGLMLGTAAYVLLGALAGVFAGRLFKVSLRYRQWVAVGFHAVTLPIVANAVLGASGIGVPYAFSFIFFMFVAAVVADERSQPAGDPEEPPPRKRAHKAPRRKKPVEAGPPAPPETKE